eukprot:TRINITY_DN12864_c0_g1_i1.p2 TRINITY_DN12864_c0_g1~~TRINITY_DN12864_c0_g1_i1.p2  ORF type:complete len:155 (-),score=56.15 TRINITY_DN12864_c0_g1_i1:7-411(-)
MAMPKWGVPIQHAAPEEMDPYADLPAFVAPKYVDLQKKKTVSHIQPPKVIEAPPARKSTPEADDGYGSIPAKISVSNFKSGLSNQTPAKKEDYVPMPFTSGVPNQFARKATATTNVPIGYKSDSANTNPYDPPS